MRPVVTTPTTTTPTTRDSTPPPVVLRTTVVYLLVAFLLGYIVGFPLLVFLVLLGGVILLGYGLLRRYWWLVGLGAAAIALALFVLYDVSNPIIVHSWVPVR
jgi:hypothetical protein